MKQYNEVEKVAYIYSGSKEALKLAAKEIEKAGGTWATFMQAYVCPVKLKVNKDIKVVKVLANFRY